MTSIADTGFVVALLNPNDSRHKACQAIYVKEAKIYLPQSILAETTYMLRRDGSPQLVIDFLRMLVRSKFEVVALDIEDFTQIQVLLQKYIDTRIDFVDASVAAVAERLDVTRILTLDKRDFSLIRPKHCDYFELLPSN